MKKIISLLFLVIFISCFIVGCSNNNAVTKTNLDIGIYEFSGTKEPLNPFVSLKENSEFTFVYSGLSSYIPVGTYEIDKNNLILKTDNGEYKYIFKIENNTIVFNKEESSPILVSSIKDGDVFVKK